MHASDPSRGEMVFAGFFDDFNLVRWITYLSRGMGSMQSGMTNVQGMTKNAGHAQDHAEHELHGWRHGEG